MNGAVYQCRSYENIDLIPEIAEQLEEKDINKKTFVYVEGREGYIG